MSTPTVSDNTTTSIWVFGYGSLTWRPGVAYTSKYYGYIKGFKRRFWQGNATHRGTPEKPGRVATLVSDNTSVLWGVAYELRGKEQIRAGLDSLTTRETKMGGYTTYTLDFYPRDSDTAPIPTLVYTATPDNELYLGPHKSIDEMALHIVTSHGQAGPNSDYVTKLADFYRKYVPEENDEHLFLLDKTIRTLLVKRSISLQHHQRKDAEKPNNSDCILTEKIETVPASKMEQIEQPFCTASMNSYDDEEQTCASSLLQTERDE